MKSLELNNIVIGYNNPLVKSINYTFNKFGIYFILGDNGIGKSTFLKTLSYEIPSLSGEIYYNKEIAINEMYSFFQNDNDVFEELLISELFKFSDIQYEQSKELLEEFEIDDLCSKKISQISSGQKQLVFLARSILLQKEIYLFDEPLTHLDYKNRKILINRLYELSKNKIVIISTHNSEFKKIESNEVFKIESQELKFSSFQDYFI